MFSGNANSALAGHIRWSKGRTGSGREMYRYQKAERESATSRPRINTASGTEEKVGDQALVSDKVVEGTYSEEDPCTPT
jgi:hypothetical protein